MAKDFADITLDDIKLKDEKPLEPTTIIDENKVKEELVDDKDKIKDEAKKEEKKEEKTQEKADKTGDDPDKVSTASDLKDDFTAEEVQALNNLSEETGVKIGSDDDLLNSLKELSEYRAGKIPGVSPVLVKALEIEKQGGDLTAFFRALSKSPDAMTETDLLRDRFLEKSDLAKSNPKLASMNFSKEFQRNYGVYLKYESLKDEEEKKEFFDKNSEDIEYQKELYAHDVAQSKKEIKDMQANFPVEKRENGLTPAQLDEVLKTHERESEAALTAFKTVNLPISGDDKFAVGLTDKTRPIVQDWMKFPEKFMNAIGLKPDKIDYGRLRDVMVLIADVSAGDFGERFQKHVLATKDIKTIETQLDKNPAKIDRAQAKVKDEGDSWDKIGEAAVAARNGRRK